jgi:hypothetical protein
MRATNPPMTIHGTVTSNEREEVALMRGYSGSDW